MLTTAQSDCMTNHGYCLVSTLYGNEQLKQLQNECEALIEQYYTKDELLKHSVYPSDSSDSRISHAVMIAQGESELPKIDHSNYQTIDKFLRDHNQLLSLVTGKQVAESSRCMLNYQKYFDGSKPVGEHFDGEYLRARKSEDGVEFTLIEGVLPRYVAVLVVENENQGKGIELVNNEKNEVIQPELNAGDLIIFDNIKLRHRVPRLQKPRISIGVRNFDHIPLHFALNKSDFLNGDYYKIAEGWVSENVDCNTRLKEFMQKEWPLMKEEYGHYF